jgi:hypothetical protein
MVGADVWLGVVVRKCVWRILNATDHKAQLIHMHSRCILTREALVSTHSAETRLRDRSLLSSGLSSSNCVSRWQTAPHLCLGLVVSAHGVFKIAACTCRHLILSWWQATPIL